MESKAEEKVKDFYHCTVDYSDGKILHINLDCILKIIYEYIRFRIGIPDYYEMDLCDEDGNPTHLYLAPEGKYGYEFLNDGQNYFAVVLQRDKMGQVSNPRPLLNTLRPTYAKLLTSLSKSYRKESEESFKSTDSEDSAKKMKKLKNRKKNR